MMIERAVGSACRMTEAKPRYAALAARLGIGQSKLPRVPSWRRRRRAGAPLLQARVRSRACAPRRWLAACTRVLNIAHTHATCQRACAQWWAARGS